MKLMSIITTLNPAHGGPVGCATQLHKNIVARGHSYDVVTLDSPDAEWNSRLPFTPIALGKKGHDPRMFEPELVKFLKQRQSEYDGSILHGIWTAPVVGMRRAWNGKHPYVVFPHGMLDPYFISKFPLKHIKKNIFYRLIAAPVLSNAVATLFTCEEERRLANHSYKPVLGTRRVVRYGVNPPSIDLNTYDGRLTELKQQLTGKDIVLYLGRIHPKKGCDLLVHAMAQLASRHPNLHLIMAGPDETGLGARLTKATEQKGLKERISWVGPVYGAERWFLYNLADAFILPSHMENFGMTVAESLSQSCPVLISDKVNIYESITRGNAGFVEPDTLEGTVALLDRWCSVERSQRSTMRENAYQLFDEQFRASYTADDVVTVFQEALQANQIAA